MFPGLFTYASMSTLVNSANFLMKDIEICVSAARLQEAVEILQSGGLYQPEELRDFNCYTEYKRGFPRLRSPAHALAVTVFDDLSQGLSPLSETIVPKTDMAACDNFSPEISDAMPTSSVRMLNWPRLPNLFNGLCQRYLKKKEDDIARIGAEQLVDGMSLSKQWFETNIVNADQDVQILANTLIMERHSRLDPFSAGWITCYVRNEQGASSLRSIPGYT